MIWKADYTGRFPQRPHWEIAELEQRCEAVMGPFLESRYGQAPVRVPTDGLTVLIEREAAQLDLHSELIAERADEEIHGVTWFYPGAKPKVQINRQLRREFRRANRYRTTLAHEYGHLLLHAWLYEHFRRELKHNEPLRCYSHTVQGSIERLSDWMEWQAGYVCGALLMPQRRVELLAGAFGRERGVSLPLNAESIDAQALAKRLSDLFDVSREAARVRLLKLGQLAS
jgi:Zn-dependent peptidase ImmA (M78 family)